MSSRPFLLDTNVLLALVRARELGRAIEERYGVTRAGPRPLLSRVTHGEIRVLAQRNSWGEQKRRALDAALGSLITIEIHHPAVIDAYVEIDIASCNDPRGARNMGKNDLWIAACARAAGLALLTTDADFDHLHPSLVRVERVDPTRL